MCSPFLNFFTGRSLFSVLCCICICIAVSGVGDVVRDFYFAVAPTPSTKSNHNHHFYHDGTYHVGTILVSTRPLYFSVYHTAQRVQGHGRKCFVSICSFHSFMFSSLSARQVQSCYIDAATRVAPRLTHVRGRKAADDHYAVSAIIARHDEARGPRPAPTLLE
jgi:hypothetical protein